MSCRHSNKQQGAALVIALLVFALAAALMLGADGVLMGTRFWASCEALVHPGQMAAGLAANLSLNPLDAVTTVTSQIVTILVGDQEFESAKTLSAFELALTLIVITLGLNFMALQIVKKYREQYE